MTSISPWFRGYRRALRDIQHGIDQHVHQSKGAKTHIYFMVADEITISLRDLKFKDSAVRQLVRQKEARFRQEALTSFTSLDEPSPAEIPQRVLFDHGYQSGFADAITIAEDYRSRMNDPNAYTAIASLIVKLKKIQAQVNDTADGEMLTLKARKYVM